MGKAKRKLYLFKFYRKNIEILCENPGYVGEVLKDIVICPICFHAFKESDVEKSDSKNNYLTIEHVPPKYLGGRTEVLTCFKCNNLFSEFDKELNYVTLRPDSKVVNWRAKLKLDEGRFGAVTEFDFTKNEVKFTWNNSNDLTRFVESLKDKNQFTFEVKDKTRAVGTNILKIAYLLAFRKFGYGLIMHPQYNFIREQIMNPYQSVLPNHGVVYFNESVALPDGIFLVKEPKELISLLVRFKIKKQNGTTEIYSVHLPSPRVDAVDFYRRMGSISKGTKYVLTDFGNVDYWHDRNFTYAAIHEIHRCLRSIS